MDINAAVYICTSHQVVAIWKPLVEENFKYKNMIIWKKNNWSMGDLKGSFAGQHEIIIFAHKGKVALEGKRDSDIWEFPRVSPDLHPTMKPVELVEYAITKIKCNKVLDLFCGSGTTIIAAEKTNKKCFGLELEEKYCDVIVKRWEGYTGKKATLETTGQTYEELCNERS
jgi:site-specific DNA-methyltransferase (adenine-specific)